ncbi:MAG: hypothetical protein ACTHQQ_13465 [Solirubrobacteraceae bacterium]
MTGVAVWRRVRRRLILVGLVFAALPVASVLANTVIGQVGGTLACFSGAAWGDISYVVPPHGGTITSFSFQSDSRNKDQQLRFLALRPVGLGTTYYTVIGETPLDKLAGTGLETFPADIAVQGGDILGLWNPRTLSNCGRSVDDFHLVFGNPESEPKVNDMLNLPVEDRVDLNESANLATAVGGPPPPTSKKQCSHAGWKTFGTMFKNHGDCVSFVATRGKNPPSGS